jgi:hypothetical protein
LKAGTGMRMMAIMWEVRLKMKKMPFLLLKAVLTGLMQGNKKAGGPARSVLDPARVVLDPARVV